MHRVSHYRRSCLAACAAAFALAGRIIYYVVVRRRRACVAHGEISDHHKMHPFNTAGVASHPSDYFLFSLESGMLTLFRTLGCDDLAPPLLDSLSPVDAMLLLLSPLLLLTARPRPPDPPSNPRAKSRRLATDMPPSPGGESA
jgi:hypothetical protein